MTFGSLAAEDLAFCSSYLNQRGIELPETSILITGGTGFLGKWLTLFVLWQKRQLNKKIKLYLLTRDVLRFKCQFPESFWALKDVVFVEGTVNEKICLKEHVDLIIHGAMDVENSLSTPLTVQTCLAGTDNIIECAKANGTSRILLVSSGAVYATSKSGKPPTEDADLVTGDMSCASGYAIGKCLAEWHLANCLKNTPISYSIARCFTFAGPFIPLDRHFAFGNFIHNALMKQDLIIKGDRRVERSYLYCADFVTWIFSILLSAPNRSVFNVGSSTVTTIGELAETIQLVAGQKSKVIFANEQQKTASVSRYFPNNEAALSDLSLSQNFGLPYMIEQTLRWATRNGI